MPTILQSSSSFAQTVNPYVKLSYHQVLVPFQFIIPLTPFPLPLRIVYKDYVSTFAQLLEKDSSVSIHIRNLQVLATEIFKARNNLSPPIVQNIFRTIKPAYSLLRDTIFESRRIQIQRYGIESLT